MSVFPNNSVRICSIKAKHWHPLSHLQNFLKKHFEVLFSRYVSDSLMSIKCQTCKCNSSSKLQLPFQNLPIFQCTTGKLHMSYHSFKKIMHLQKRSEEFYEIIVFQCSLNEFFLSYFNVQL